MVNKLFKPLLEALPENNRMERIWVLSKTDFLKRYYGSVLGLLWALINPVAQLGIYYFVFTTVFEKQQENFALFLFLGLVFDLLFNETSTLGLNIIRFKRHILENIQINWLDIYYAAGLSTLFAFLFNFSAYFLISLFMDIEIHAQAWFLPLLVLNLWLFGFAIQIILSIVQIYFRDVVHLWDLAKLIIMWLSGIFYQIDFTPGSKSEILGYLTPMAGTLHNSREVLIYGRPIDWALASYDWIYSIFLLGVALFLYFKFARKALEKI